MFFFSDLLKKREYNRVAAGQHGGGEFTKNPANNSPSNSPGNISIEPEYVIKPLSPLDKKIIDFKPDRSLSDPKAIRPIEQVIPNAKFVPYSEVPFFDALNKLIGVDPRTESIEKYAKARGKFLASLPVKKIPLDSIVVTQQMVNKDKVAKLVEQDDASSKPIAAVRYKGQTYIMDGHHRTVAAMLRGDTDIEGHMMGWVIDLDKKKNKKKLGKKFKKLLKSTSVLLGSGFANILKYEKGKLRWTLVDGVRVYTGLETHDEPEADSKATPDAKAAAMGKVQRLVQRVNPQNGAQSGQQAAASVSEQEISDHLNELGLKRFDKPEFRQEWAKHLPNVTPTDFMQGMFGKMHATEGNFNGQGTYGAESLHTLDFRDGTLSLGGNGVYVHGAEATVYSRQFHLGKEPKEAYHNLLQLDKSSQGGGVVKSVFRESMPLYRKMGIEKISLTAGMDRGAYAWAKYGFGHDQSDPKIEHEKAHMDWMSKKLTGENGLVKFPEHLSQGGQIEFEHLQKVLKGEHPNKLWLLADMKTPELDRDLGNGIDHINGGTTVKKLMENTASAYSMNLKDPVAMTRLARYIKNSVQKGTEGMHWHRGGGGEHIYDVNDFEDFGDDDMGTKSRYDMAPPRFRAASTPDIESNDRRPLVKYTTDSKNLVDVFHRFKLDGGNLSHHHTEMARQWKAVMGDVHPHEVLRAFLGKNGITNHNFSQLEIHIDPTKKTVGISGRGEDLDLDYNGRRLEGLHRTFHMGDHKSVEHNLLKVAAKDQGGGLVKGMMRDCLPLYDKLGIQSVGLCANIDGGGSTWGKFGFEFYNAAEKRNHQEQVTAEMHKLLESKGHGFDADSPKGKKFMNSPAGKELTDFLTVTFAKGNQTIWQMTDMKTPALDKMFKDEIAATFKKGGTYAKLLLNKTRWAGTLMLQNKKGTKPIHRIRLEQYIGLDKT